MAVDNNKLSTAIFFAHSKRERIKYILNSLIDELFEFKKQILKLMKGSDCSIM